MSRIISAVLSLTAVVVLTLGTAFAAAKDCCPNGPCCKSGCSHCQHHNNK